MATLRLDNTTLVCLDTNTQGLARAAVQFSRSRCAFAKCLYFSDVDWNLDDCVYHPIAPIRSRRDYGRFMLERLVDFVETEFVLVMQFDGFVFDPACWTDDFFRFDYIGAPWRNFTTYRVGNGGFSLRSRRLLSALRDRRILWEGEAEDAFIGRTYRSYLEVEHGIRFPDVDLAFRFSWEGGERPCESFGFHGLYFLNTFYTGEKFNYLMEHLAPYCFEGWQIILLAARYLDMGATGAAARLMRRIAEVQGLGDVAAVVRDAGNADPDPVIAELCRLAGSAS